MGSEWVETTLGEICKQQGGSIQTGPFGSQLHASDYQVAGIPVVMPINLVDGRIDDKGIARIDPIDVERLARHKLGAGDIVFSRRGDVTRFALVSEKEVGWLCGTGCLKVSFGQQTMAIARFISGVLAKPDTKEWLVRHAVGATMPNINTEILSNIPIVLPPVEEQRAIAHILGTLDDKIELNRRINQTLEARAQAIFKSWFVDFDLVKAKISAIEQGQDPERAAMRAISGKTDAELDQLPRDQYDQLATTAALFPQAMQDTEHDEIPDGWEMTTLSCYATLNPESWSKKTRPNSIRYVDLSGTKWGRIESMTDFSSGDAPSRAQRVLRPWDTLVGTVRPGNGSYALISEEGLTGSTGFAVLRPTHRRNAAFVYLAATGAENIERLANLADGGAYPAIRPEVVAATLVPKINEHLLDAFSQQVDSIFEAMASNEHQSRTLAQLRDTLLPKLISGELSVSEKRNK